MVLIVITISRMADGMEWADDCLAGPDIILAMLKQKSLTPTRDVSMYLRFA